MKNFKGGPRHIGVELEFYGVKPRDVAEIVSSVFKGEIERVHEDLYKVQSKFGEFQLETDAKLVKKLSQASEENKKNKRADFDGALVEAIKFFSDEVVPTELVSPPLKISDLHIINEVQDKLVEKGAEGTSESFRFAFAAQLNPEIQSQDCSYILNMLKSFIVLSDWLKNQIGMDITRKLTSYAADFPKKYTKKIFDSKYAPDLGKFIDDYLEYNPTRNRGLDLLPLLSYLDEERVAKACEDERIKSRPTFHYRLPNSQLSLKSWNIEVEWSRWLVVERLMQEKKLFDTVCDHYRCVLNDEIESDWLIEMNNYTEALRK